MKFLIIGAGWYGCHLADYLISVGSDVTIIDKANAIFTGSSFRNQNRLHLGFHYPRSTDTITECQQGYKLFKERYPDIREPLINNFYFVSTTLSHMNATDYITTMQQSNIHTKLVQQLPTGLPEVCNMFPSIIQVEEEYINPFKARDYFVKRLGPYLKQYNPDISGYDMILNCTYNHYKPIEFQIYELFLTLLYFIPVDEPFAYTVMDGPFFSIYPYDKDRKLYTVTSVIHGPVYKGRIPEFEMTGEILENRRTLIEEQIQHYIPEFKKVAEYNSYYTSWKTKHASTTDDRTVKWKMEGNMLSIYGGKITGIFEAEQILKNIMDRSAIIGWTGFVGNTLTLSVPGEVDLYNSRNIETIRGKTYGTIYISGLPAEKWRINQEPEKDYAVLEQLMDVLKTITVSRVILISTVDVLDCTIEQDEDGDTFASHPYGRHRRIMEEFIEKEFETHHIIRLPGLFGKGLKKNVIYDFLHNKKVTVSPDSLFQWYNIENLPSDINTCIEKDIKCIQLVSDPISVRDIIGEIESQTSAYPVIYKLTSKYRNDRNVRNELVEYISSEKRQSKFIPVISNIAWDTEDTVDVLKILARYKISHIESAFPKLTAPSVSCQSIFYGKTIITKNDFIYHYKHVAETCSNYGVKIIVFGSPTIRHVVANDVTLFRQIGDISNTYGITFCIEPNAKAYGACWLNKLEETTAFVKQVSHPCIKVNFDLGNYVMENDDSVIDIQHIAHIQVSAPFLAPLNKEYIQKYRELLAPFENQNRYVSLEMKQTSLLELFKSIDIFMQILG